MAWREDLTKDGVMPRFVVAVSGGVDSVVLLDKLAADFKPADLIVAHFDHGIRPDSAHDATFVRELAAGYGAGFETKREELGPGASEELARERRYAFLRDVAKRLDAEIVTAHHADDVVETIAINIARGTGWRGVAVLDSSDILRPLLVETKAELIAYANEHALTWHEDSTNDDVSYLRNDLRKKLVSIDTQAKELLRLYRERQVVLKELIDTETAGLIGDPPYARHPFIMANEQVANELLRRVFVGETSQSLTRPQLTRALHAIKTLQPGKLYEAGDGSRLRFTRTHFVVEKP